MAKPMPRRKGDEALHINRKEVKRFLRTPLPAEKKNEVMDDLLHKLKDHDELDTERKEVNKGYKGRLDALADEAKKLRTNLEEGVEEEVVCEEVKDFNAGTWTLKRLDTGEEVERRELTEDERQPDMLQGEGGDEGDQASA